MEDKRLEALFDHLTVAINDIYEHMCEVRNKDSDDSAKMIFDWYEFVIKDYVMTAIKAYEQEQLKLELKKVLNELDNILSYAYECEPNSHRAERINEVEDQLIDILSQKGMI